MLKKPVNENYCGTIVEIKNIIPLNNCDNVVHTNIMGNLVIVGKDVRIGDIGIFFPVETKLSNEFLSNNNLYRKPELNKDQSKKGYFEESGRIRCVKFRQNPSMGFFIPLSSLDFTNHKENLKVNNSFDEINDIKICEKYSVHQYNMQGSGTRETKHKKQRISRLIENQFHYHIDTPQLYKNIHRVNKDDIISITRKVHGTSGISSKVLCKKLLNVLEKILKLFGVSIIETEYYNLYSSRKVIKNSEIQDKEMNHFYKIDIWKLANDKLKDFIDNGMTLYYEIIGFLPDGKYIQKDYDYGCNQGEFEIQIYRITYTNDKGKVFEFSARQVQQWCFQNGLKPVKEFYYGKAIDIFNWEEQGYSPDYDNGLSFQENFIEKLKNEYLEKDCFDNKYKKVPEEGIVLRIENLNIDPMKLKSLRFLEYETKCLDENVENIEDNN